MNIKQAYQQQIHAEWQHLADYWYPLVETKSLLNNTMIKVSAFNVNYLVWKNKQGETGVFLDICCHKQAPLSEGHLQENQLTCPYHGWQFDDQGNCVNIPYSDQTSNCANKSLLKIISKNNNGIIWFFPGNQKLALNTVHNRIYEDWLSLEEDLVKTEEFACDEQALIENFMDSPHTNFIHSGLIRKTKKLKPREIVIYIDEQQKLIVDHLPSDETLGPFNWFINPSKNPIHHQDMFIAPSQVDIQYQFEKEKTNFRTQIIMCPIDKNRTRAFFKITCQFRLFNPLIRVGLKLFLPIILKQDKKIVDLQFNNPSKLAQFKGEFIDYDLYSYQVKLLREQAKTQQASTGLISSVHHTLLKL
ncbi:Rieske 2Fe-2S domain-containing protein [Psychromonas sp.]|nr:Rieske 2Fe-2S domain-containing protein [Psychromonas sp.]